MLRPQLDRRGDSPPTSAWILLQSRFKLDPDAFLARTGVNDIGLLGVFEPFHNRLPRLRGYEVGSGLVVIQDCHRPTLSRLNYRGRIFLQFANAGARVGEDYVHIHDLLMGLNSGLVKVLSRGEAG